MIVVDEDGSVRPDQVMWAISVKVNPAGDVIMLPNMSENLLDRRDLDLVAHSSLGFVDKKYENFLTFAR